MMPYTVYSACTVLLLAPEDPAAMEGARTGLACLDGMDQTGYWVESARDAGRRVRALADKWGVELEISRRVLGLAGGGKAQCGSSPPTNDLTQISESGSMRPSASGSVHVLEGGMPGYLDEATLASGIEAVVDRTLQLVQSATLSQPINLTENPPPHFEHYLPQPLARQVGYHPYQCSPPKSQPLPHVAYGSSHADPQHDMHLAHSHWHNIIPSPESNLLFPPDPSACADLGTCFNYTVEHAEDPVFVDQVGDPYAGVSMDWSGFPRFGVPAFVGDGYGYEAGW